MFSAPGLNMRQLIGQPIPSPNGSRTGNISFQNNMVTINHTLGIPLTARLPDCNGRPQFLLDDPQPIWKLVE